MFPESKPAFGAVRLDALGYVWVSEYSLGQVDRSGQWTVFNPDGRMRRTTSRKLPRCWRIAGINLAQNSYALLHSLPDPVVPNLCSSLNSQLYF